MNRAFSVRRSRSPAAPSCGGEVSTDRLRTSPVTSSPTATPHPGWLASSSRSTRWCRKTASGRKIRSPIMDPTAGHRPSLHGVRRARIAKEVAREAQATTRAAARASGVSHLCACIGSPCLRHCGHGASIGGHGPWRPLDLSRLFDWGLPCM
jgi:hypothetical protein